MKKISYQQEKRIQEKQKPYTHILKVIDNWARKAYRKHLIEEKELAQREERLKNNNYSSKKNILLISNDQEVDLQKLREESIK